MSQDVRATIKFYNYRCFSDKRPGILEIRPGFTAFVGPNNSGKSTLLRAIRELKGVFGAIADPNTLTALLRGDNIGFAYQDVEDPDELFHNGNNGPLIVVIEVPGTGSDEILELQLHGDRVTKGWIATAWIGPQRLCPTQEEIRTQGLTIPNAAGGRTNVSLATLRKLVEVLNQAVYIPAFRHAISGATGIMAGDLLLGTEFLNTWAAWQSGSIKWQRQRIRHVVDDIRTLFGYRELDIQPAVGNTTLQVWANGKDFRLREMGAGLTQFVLVLATVAIKKPTYVFIDEPELNLHPTLQQEFLTAVAAYSSCGVVFATHSLGLAKSGAEYLYAAKRDGMSSSIHEWDVVPSIGELLGELNYSSYRDAGHERVICVEGLHDVRPIRQLLRLLNAEQSTLVVQGGGDQLCTDAGVEMIVELQRLAKNVYILLDSERSTAGGPPKESRTWLVGETKRLGVRVQLTDRRAFENYLPEAAVQRAYGPNVHGLGPYEEHDARWPKRDNWRIAREIQAEELEDTDLVRFLREAVGR
jgi:predicted ATPase